MSDNGRKEVTPMPKITDEQYRYLSRAVYFVGKFPNQYRKGRMVRFMAKSMWWKTSKAIKKTDFRRWQ